MTTDHEIIGQVLRRTTGHEIIGQVLQRTMPEGRTPEEQLRAEVEEERSRRQDATREVRRLEQELAAARAEVEDLRGKLRECREELIRWGFHDTEFVDLLQRIAAALG